MVYSYPHPHPIPPTPTPRSVVLHICINELGLHWLRLWLVASSVTSHYTNQCGIIVNWTLDSWEKLSVELELELIFIKKMHLK